MNRDRKSELLARYEAGDQSVYEEALSLYEKAVSEDPENTELLHRYGFLYERKGKELLRKAASIYEKGIQVALKPENIAIREKQHCHGQLISLRAMLGECEKSIDLYKEYIKKYPDKANGYVLLAYAYFRADQIDEAKLTIETAYKIAPKDPGVNSWMGEVYQRIGRLEEALEYFKTSVELDPVYISSRFSRAFILERLSRLNEAVDEWKLIIKYLHDNGFEIEAAYPERELARLESKINSTVS